MIHSRRVAPREKMLAFSMFILINYFDELKYLFVLQSEKFLWSQILPTSPVLFILELLTKESMCVLWLNMLPR